MRKNTNIILAGLVAGALMVPALPALSDADNGGHRPTWSKGDHGRKLGHQKQNNFQRGKWEDRGRHVNYKRYERQGRNDRHEFRRHARFDRSDHGRFDNRRHGRFDNRGVRHNPEIRQDFKDVRNARKEVQESRRDLHKDYAELRKDRAELRRDIRNGASKEEIFQGRREIRNDLKEIRESRAELNRDQAQLDAARRELRNDLRNR
jgi:hypothetical protein